MKKKMLLGLLVTIPFLTACGSNGGSGNVMRCSDYSGAEMSGYAFKFDGDKLSKMGMFEGIDLNKVSKEDGCTDKSSCTKLAETALPECENDEYMESCNIESDDDTVIIVGYYNEKRMKSERNYSVGMSKSEVKKQAESEGFTCR